MRAFLQKNHRPLFYFSWLALGIIQSRWTELLDDEAYYWVYSKFLDWGYFDHPPMVAMLIKAGYFICHNELGVRLLFLLLSTLSLLVIEQLLAYKRPLLFYTIVLSLAALQLGGFVAVPDTPLIFFTALFFWCYKEFVEKSSLKNTFLLGLVAAALLYSKYHAVLIILFVLLSNFKLFLKYQTYLAGLVALLCFVPHLWWQYQHDWVSVRYHLFESNVNPYKISHTLDYIVGQILLAGPVAGFILLPAAFLSRTKSVTDRSLKFTLVGVYIFFLIMSFRGKVEANWTSPAIVPLIILSHSFLAEERSTFASGGKKWLFRLLAVTLVLVFCARIVMIFDLLPVKQVREQYHGWRHWPQVMRQKTDNLPVVFENSYQRASKYWFYSGQMTYSLNWYRERRNNYNFWPIEDSILGKPVFILDVHNLDSFQNKMTTPIGTVGYRYDSAFASFAKVSLVSNMRELKIHSGEKVNIFLRFSMPEKYERFFLSHPGLSITITAGVFNKKGWVEDIPVEHSLYDVLDSKGESLSLNTSDLPGGNYFLIFSIYKAGNITGTHNSDKIKLTVE